MDGQQVSRLGKYEILEEIGRGGFATVYKDLDPGLQRQVALKVLHPHLAGDRPFVERFLREARAAASLNHPHIVTIYEVGEEQGDYYIAMQYLSGPSLMDIIANEAPVGVERAVELLTPVAQALDYAHGRGFIHRDVKPSNIVLDEEGRPVLTDFGLVRAEEDASTATLSMTGMTLGTPQYMAPEQADPDYEGELDGRCDVYALGVVAYELLTGRPPFRGKTPLKVLMAQVSKSPPRPQEVNSNLPEAAGGVLLKALAKIPDERYQSGNAFMQALKQAGSEAKALRPEPAEGVTRSEEMVVPSDSQVEVAEREPTGVREWRQPPLPPNLEDTAQEEARAEASISTEPRVRTTQLTPQRWGVPRLAVYAGAFVAILVLIVWLATGRSSGTKVSSATPVPLVEQQVAIGGTTTDMAVPATATLRIPTPTPVPPMPIPTQANFLLKWGNRGSDDRQFYWPSGVAVDAKGNVYVVETYNYRIQVFESNGSLVAKWGTLGSGDGQFDQPHGVAADAQGNVYVADSGHHRIQVFDSNGSFIAKWGSYGSGDGQFYWPSGVAVDAKGNVYVADRYNQRIQVFDSNGNFIAKWGSYGSGDGQFNGPYGVVVDAKGNVYVADTRNNRIQKFDSTGNLIAKWGSYGSGDGQFFHPTDVAVEASSNVYVVDTKTTASRSSIPMVASSPSGEATVATMGSSTSLTA